VDKKLSHEQQLRMQQIRAQHIHQLHGKSQASARSQATSQPMRTQTYQQVRELVLLRGTVK